jgi:hypothetical protein
MRNPLRNRLEMWITARFLWINGFNWGKLPQMSYRLPKVPPPYLGGGLGDLLNLV